MKKIKLKYIVAALLGAGIIFAYLFLNNRAVPVLVASPKENIPIQVFGLGTIEARILSKVGFEVGAALIMVDADHGDMVKKGQILARLHSGVQNAKVARAKAGVVRASAAAKKADAAIGKAWAVLAQKKQANKRKQALVVNRTISAEAAEEAQMEEDVATAELAVVVSDADVAKAALEDAKALYGVEATLLSHHVLKAPYDAVVVQRHKELGTVLGAGEPLFTLVAPDTVWALAYIDEARAGNIKIGQPTEIHLRSLPQLTFEGFVVRIDKESDRVSEERRVYIACNQCPKNFHLGEQIEVLITTATLDKALLIPETAIQQTSTGTGTVWTVEDGILQRRNVRLGYRTLDARVEVLADLPAGTYVISEPHSGLQEGKSATTQVGPTAEKNSGETS